MVQIRVKNVLCNKFWVGDRCVSLSLDISLQFCRATNFVPAKLYTRIFPIRLTVRRRTGFEKKAWTVRNGEAATVTFDRAKRGASFDFSVQRVSWVCLSDEYGHTPSPIVMAFGVNVRGTKVEWRMCMDLFFSFTFRNGGRFYWVFFAVTGFERGTLFRELL